MARKPHPNKEIEIALRYAERHGWRVERARGHAWGRMFCPAPDTRCACGEFCITCIWSTPRSPEVHARQLTRVVDRCLGQAVSPDDGQEEAP